LWSRSDDKLDSGNCSASSCDFTILAGKAGLGYNCELASQHLWQLIVSLFVVTQCWQNFQLLCSFHHTCRPLPVVPVAYCRPIHDNALLTQSGNCCACCACFVETKLAGKGGLGYNCELASQHLWQFVSARASVWTDLMHAALRDYYATGTYVTSAPPQQQSSNSANPTMDDAAANADAADDANAAASPLWNVRLQWSQRYRLRQALLRFLLMAESGSEAGSANAAWMLMRGEGAGGQEAVDLAADLLLR
jgi:hypothetical protein